MSELHMHNLFMLELSVFSDDHSLETIFVNHVEFEVKLRRRAAKLSRLPTLF